MKMIYCFLFFLSGEVAIAQQQTENIIIITTDGFRWQEIFGGMDSSIANNSKYHQGDSEAIFKKYWDKDEKERRKKLMPFLWTTVLQKGQLYGNRKLGSKIDNANPYRFSYPGYSEIFTGFADTNINRNDYPPNPHETVLEFLNKQPKTRNKIAAFGAWDAFDRILNEQKTGIPVFSAFDKLGGNNPNSNERLLNALQQDIHKPWNSEECFDVFTHFGAMEYLKSKRPKVLYIAYGETDEWAHAGQYRSYLDAAHQVDQWLKEIWDWVQSDPQYRNRTTLFITVDHGRGDAIKEDWTSHNNKVADSHEIWLGVIGPDSPVRGELNSTMQFYQQQFAQTIAKLMGYNFKAKHPVADEILSVFKMKK